MAVLENDLVWNLGNCDAYVNIAGGIKMNGAGQSISES